MAEHPARLVVLVTTGIEEYQFSLLSGMHPVLDAHRLARVIYMDWGETAGLPGDLVQFLREADPVGLLSTNLCREGHLDKLARLSRELSLPLVVIGADLPEAVCVRGDNATGMRALMRHLLDDCGVRRPVLVRGFPHQQDSMEREAIFRDELARRDVPVDEDLVIDGLFVADIAHQAMRALLQRRRDFDAVVVCNDRAARGCIGALTDVGLRVPEDVLVTGFDNDQDTLQWPGLTTVDQDLPEQGRRAAELLVTQIQDGPGDGTRRMVVVPSKLVTRDSTSIRPRSDQEQLRAALRMVETASAHLGRKDASEGLARATLAARTLPEVIEAFTSCLSWIKFRRCFVAIRSDLCGELRDTPTDLFSEDEDPPDGGHHPVSTVRLLLDYRDGTAHTPPPDPFPAHQMLPAQLRGQLAEGLLVATALSTGRREYGYLLMERDPSALAFEETVHVDLSRALDSVFNRQALEAHAARLEKAVERRTEELERRTEELACQTRELAHRTEELQTEVSIRKRAEHQLQLANAELHRAAMRDGLTGIANRAAFEEHVTYHWDLLARIYGSMALLMVDVDLFKKYNDHYGHIAGDDTLRAVAECLRQSVTRSADLVARYGGEEFVVVLPQGDSRAGLTVAMRFQAALAERAIPHAASEVAEVVTASVGIAVANPDGRVPPTGLVATADQALYRAKQLGRNRAVLVENQEIVPIPSSDSSVVRPEPA